LKFGAEDLDFDDNMSDVSLEYFEGDKSADSGTKELEESAVSGLVVEGGFSAPSGKYIRGEGAAVSGIVEVVVSASSGGDVKGEGSAVSGIVVEGGVRSKETAASGKVVASSSSRRDREERNAIRARKQCPLDWCKHKYAYPELHIRERHLSPGLAVGSERDFQLRRRRRAVRFLTDTLVGRSCSFNDLSGYLNMKRVGFNHRFRQIDEYVYSMVCNFEMNVNRQHPRK
jgi:hypothetical protein